MNTPSTLVIEGWSLGNGKWSRLSFLARCTVNALLGETITGQSSVPWPNFSNCRLVIWKEVEKVMSLVHSLKISLVHKSLIPCSIPHCLSTELWRTPMIFRLAFSQSKLVLLSLGQLMFLWNFVLSFPWCYPPPAIRPILTDWLTSTLLWISLILLFWKAVPLHESHTFFLFIVFRALLYICQVEGQGLWGKTSLSVCILGSQVDFAS